MAPEGYSMKLPCNLAVAVFVALAACSSEDTKTDADYEREIVGSMHQLLLGQVRGLNQAARDIATTAPTPVGRGWGDSENVAIEAMKDSWVRARIAWEPAEGALVPLFQDLDGALDARYEDLLKKLGPDDNLFDGTGVTGMHAVERVLFANVIPADVITQESTFPGYKPASWPATDDEARQFKEGLCARLVTDSQILVDTWEPRAINLRDVFQGLTSLMDEQQDKLRLAANHEEESRYAMRTLGDLRDNLAGTRAVYDLFVPWLLTKPFGTPMNRDVQQAFDRLQQIYGTVSGEAIPSPPPTWDSSLPSAPDQQSPFGILYAAVVQEVDGSRAGSAVDSMNQVARALGLPEFAAGN
jgi:iron uptake system component EfeO